MAPLNTPGYRYPCKGFPKGPSTATYSGTSIRVSLEGSATHMGGHCQFGITYDQSNFLVLKTIYRTCLLSSLSYQFDLPFNIPNGDVTIFWSWINRIGGREYYMECADITVNNNNFNRNVPLTGLELLVVNLPGYRIVPEFPQFGPNDGTNLLNQRRSLTIYANGGGSPGPVPTTTTSRTSTSTSRTSTSASRTRTSRTSTTTLPTNIPLPVNCNTGNMKCKSSRERPFYMCVHGMWYALNCAPGTVCESTNENTIECVY
jgi:hypothetical protein